MSDLTGKSIGRYHIIEKLGQGGMAAVFKAYDTHLEREVAIKLIRTDTIGPAYQEAMLKRFERESKALARFAHPNIVHIHDYGEFEGRPYLVMEYLTGGTLKARAGAPLPCAEAARILAPVARALHYAHQRGIIHRDVKPANILFSENGDPMLTDFGIAKVLEEGAGQTLTGTGVGIGTPEYMSPEQGMGRKVDHRTDIYALGVVFYELLTGRRPYEGDTPLAIVVRHIQDPLPRPTDFVSNVPPAAEQVIIKAMAKQPDDRYADMEAFASALEKLARSFPTAEMEASRTQTALPDFQPSAPSFTAPPIRVTPPPVNAAPALQPLGREASPAGGGVRAVITPALQPIPPLAAAPRRGLSSGLIALLVLGALLLCVVLAGVGYLVFRSLGSTGALAAQPSSTASMAAVVQEDTATPEPPTPLISTLTSVPSTPAVATPTPVATSPQATPTLVPLVYTPTLIVDTGGVAPLNTPILPWSISLQDEENTYGLIAYYPMWENAVDLSGNQFDIILLNAPFSNGGVYSNGIYTNDSPEGCLIETPPLNGFDFNSFSIRTNFLVSEYQDAPVFVGGHGWRWIGFILGSDGSLSLLTANADYITCSGSYILNLWHDALVTYDGSVGRMYLDGTLVCESSNVLDNGGDNDVSNTNFARGSTFKGWLRDLKIYNHAIEPYY